MWVLTSYTDLERDVLVSKDMVIFFPKLGFFDVLKFAFKCLKNKNSFLLLLKIASNKSQRKTYDTTGFINGKCLRLF